jgi:hypothetical protein
MTSADLISDESLEEFASKIKEKIPDPLGHHNVQQHRD